MMKCTIPAIISVLLCICLFSSGCLTYQTSESTQPPCDDQEPVVGTWIYDPGGLGDAVFLFIFKDSGRYDAAAIPRDDSKELDYEVWITGSWTAAGIDSYNVAGQIISHDFRTDTREVSQHNENLTYDPLRDALFNREHPHGIFTRVSCNPQIPSTMKVSIPFD